MQFRKIERPISQNLFKRIDHVQKAGQVHPLLPYTRFGLIPGISGHAGHAAQASNPLFGVDAFPLADERFRDLKHGHR